MQSFIDAFVAGDESAGWVFLDWVEDRECWDEVLAHLEVEMAFHYLTYLAGDADSRHSPAYRRWSRLERLHWGVTMRQQDTAFTTL